MEIALTKKLADATGIKVQARSGTVNPLFCWTANWTNTWKGRKEDLLVMVNQATRFAVIIYGIKRKQLKNVEQKMIDAIRHTLQAMNINPEVIDDYLKQAGDVNFTVNKDRTMTAWVNSLGRDAVIVVPGVLQSTMSTDVFDDTIGRFVSWGIVNCGGKSSDVYVPAERMIAALAEVTGKPVYKYRAFELLVTLDLEVYQATRRIIVPADLEFSRLHLALQSVYNWHCCHLFDFAIFDDKDGRPVAILVADQNYLPPSPEVTSMNGRRLSHYLPENPYILYTYDMGDNWEHRIELIRVIDDYDKESPYLLESVGQAPPEDAGGVPGFIEFYRIMLDPDDPEHDETLEWARSQHYWPLDFSGDNRAPRPVHC